MPHRNQPIISEIVDVINITREQEQHLLEHFNHRLIIDAGSVQLVAAYAETLRLAITEEECSQVLDVIGLKQMTVLTMEQVDEVVNELFPDRFIEP